MNDEYQMKQSFEFPEVTESISVWYSKEDDCIYGTKKTNKGSITIKYDENELMRIALVVGAYNLDQVPEYIKTELEQAKVV